MQLIDDDDIERYWVLRTLGKTQRRNVRWRWVAILKPDDVYRWNVSDPERFWLKRSWCVGTTCVLSIHWMMMVARSLKVQVVLMENSWDSC